MSSAQRTWVRFVSSISHCTLRDGTASQLGVIATSRSLAGYDAVVLASCWRTMEQLDDGEAHDRSFRLPEFQDDLIVNATELNPRTIVVLHGGGGFNVQAWV